MHPESARDACVASRLQRVFYPDGAPSGRRRVRKCDAAALAGPAAHAYTAAMDQQLVIKFWRKSLENEDFLGTLETELKQALGDAVEMEGHDVSQKEINLFLTTADPRLAFRRAKDILERLGIEYGVSAAYRVVGGVKFTSIWPVRAMRKFTLP